MLTSDFSPAHRALPRIFANPKESQLAEITQLLFQSGSKRWVAEPLNFVLRPDVLTSLRVLGDDKNMLPGHSKMSSLMTKAVLSMAYQPRGQRDLWLSCNSRLVPRGGTGIPVFIKPLWWFNPRAEGHYISANTRF
jgi:hypothetical protein